MIDAFALFCTTTLTNRKKSIMLLFKAVGYLFGLVFHNRTFKNELKEIHIQLNKTGYVMQPRRDIRPFKK